MDVYWDEEQEQHDRIGRTLLWLVGAIAVGFTIVGAAAWWVLM